MASLTVSSLKTKVLVHTLFGRHHIIHLNNISPTWLLGLCQKCLTHWQPIHVFICFFVFFCISPSAYFCHIVKLLIKKETRLFPTVFFLLSLPVSVGLITTNYNQLHLSSLLKSKCQKDKPCGSLWMIKPRGPSQAASEPEPSLQESTLPAENQLALVTKAPNLRHLHCSAKWRDEPLFF